VNLYAYGLNATGLAGNRENTEIGEHIASLLGLNLDVVTLELNKCGESLQKLYSFTDPSPSRRDVSWHSTSAGKSPQTTQRRTEVKHYHGDF
jgi:alkaline phosphatase